MMLIEMLDRARVDTPDGHSFVYKRGRRYSVEDGRARYLIDIGKAVEVMLPRPRRNRRGTAAASLDANIVAEPPSDVEPVTDFDDD